MRDPLRKNEDEGGAPGAGELPAGGARTQRVREGGAPLALPSPKPTRQFADLVLAPIDPKQLAALRSCLQKVNEQTIRHMKGGDVPDALIPFHEIAGLHFARFVVLDERVGAQALLAFTTDYDGPEGEPDCSQRRAREAHQQALAMHPGFETIFSHCRNYKRGKLLSFLNKHQRPASTSYVAAPGRSLQQIRWEAALRRQVETLLMAQPVAPRTAEQVRQEVLTQLANTPFAAIPPFAEQPSFPWEKRLALGAVAAAGTLIGGSSLAFAVPLSLLGPAGIALAAALGTGSVLTVAGLAAARFAWLEARDPQFQPTLDAETHKRLAIAAKDENHFLQNQLTHVVQIKDGPLRWLLIRVVFAVLQELATYRFNRGKLGDIPSIHFARWALGPDRSVIFFSNFDSSWQSYLGDFIDKASSGLTAVWSNTKLYPRTKWLVTAGSRDAGRFLSWTRAHQLPTQVWYSAYPQLSVVNINANTLLRRGLADDSKVDPVSWLSTIRNVDRLEVDERYSAEQARETPLNLDDIQGLILKGYGHKKEARYLLLQVPTEEVEGQNQERQRARVRWLSELPVTSTVLGAKVREAKDPLINVAFTYQGLRALGLEPDLCEAFSTPFVQGATHEDRLRVNHDVGDDAPEHWEWGGCPEKSVHVALLIFASKREHVLEALTSYRAQAAQHGFKEVTTLEANTLHNRTEHFGFRDGIAQPIVKGSGDPGVAQNTIAAGEILLGHRDGYGNVAPAPTSSEGFRFGFNGSYMVLRQLEQNVEEFWKSCHEKGEKVGLNAVSVASKMVGRWPSGRPLVRHPDKDPEPNVVSNDDGFGYFEAGSDNDRYGGKCPFGAHIRRSNPRDWGLGASSEESVTLSNLHRIMRRGRPYGPPLTESMKTDEMLELALKAPKAEAGTGQKRGLNFICFNANIERQFEFIQQQWCKNPKFAGQHSDADPLLGLRRSASELGLDDNGLTLQCDLHSGSTQRIAALEPFVSLKGSAYFFMPSVRALRLLPELTTPVRQAQTPSIAQKYEQAPHDEQLHIDRLIDNTRLLLQKRDAGKQTRRDAHPKMHGCVKAELTVYPGIAQDLQHGLFRVVPGAAAASYKGWVRFSNQDQNLVSDVEKDTRGLALKLLDVDGAKLLDGEEDSSCHDFIFLSTPCFVATDVAGFDELVNALVQGSALSWLRSAGPALRHYRSKEKHGSPLEVTYFSVVPSLLGPHAVKYTVSPQEESKSPLPRKGEEGSENFLRARLKEQLGQRERLFDVSVQRFESEQRTPIEDPTVQWKTPLEKVATLRIIQQDDFDERERDEMGENLAFNPFRCLPEHRPLGGINRARRQVYRAISRFRHDRNGVKPGPVPRW